MPKQDFRAMFVVHRHHRVGPGFAPFPTLPHQTIRVRTGTCAGGH
jgi:hypothetical protein